MKIPAKLVLVEYESNIGINQIVCKNKITNLISAVLYNGLISHQWQPVRIEIHSKNECVSSGDKLGLIRVYDSPNLIFETLGKYGVNAPDVRDMVLGYFDTKQEAENFIKEVFIEKDYYINIDLSHINEIAKNNYDCFIEGRIEMKGNISQDGEYEEFETVVPKVVSNKIIIYLK
jgi:hypothetical protein